MDKMTCLVAPLPQFVQCLGALHEIPGVMHCLLFHGIWYERNQQLRSKGATYLRFHKNVFTGGKKTTLCFHEILPK